MNSRQIAGTTANAASNSVVEVSHHESAAHLQPPDLLAGLFATSQALHQLCNLRMLEMPLKTPPT
jgi:hypothetical protein